MNARTILLVLCLAPLPTLVSAADPKPDGDATTAGAAATAAPAGDADALFKQIQEMKPPSLDAARRGDREYIQSYIKEMQAAAQKRAELAKKFVDTYPDDSRKTEALHMRAESLMRGNVRGAEFTGTVDAFVKAAPADPRGAMLLFRSANMERDEAKQTPILRRIVEQYPDTDAAKMAGGQLRQTEAVGKPFALAFTDAISGRKFSIDEGLKGKVVVVDFWATWCGPCVAEMPHMKELYAKYKDQGVEFVGVSLDAPESEGGLEKLKAFVEQNAIAWPQYYQGKGWDSEFSKSWGINGIPTLFIVDANGNLHSTRARGQLDQMIPDLLAKRVQ